LYPFSAVHFVDMTVDEIEHVHTAKIVRSESGSSYGFHCSCGVEYGLGMREGRARAALFKHIGHEPSIYAVRATGFGGRGGWAYKLTCACGASFGDPMSHAMNAEIRHSDHVYALGHHI
jgi:hypothetical protein